MPLPEFFGICGRYNVRPCKIAWSNIDTNPRVGTYPSELLPSRRTIWHASSQGYYSFQAPIITPGETFGLPILGLFTATGALSIQSDVFTPFSRIVISFARTANRLNAAHVLTQTEFDAAVANNGVVEIDVGEYVFEAIAVTDTQEDITTDLTEEEVASIAGQQSESDRVFRKLFEQSIPEDRNRLIGVRVNKEGIEYRLDNGGPRRLVPWTAVVKASLSAKGWPILIEMVVAESS